MLTQLVVELYCNTPLSTPCRLSSYPTFPPKFLSRDSDDCSPMRLVPIMCQYHPLLCYIATDSEPSSQLQYGCKYWPCRICFRSYSDSRIGRGGCLQVAPRRVCAEVQDECFHRKATPRVQEMEERRVSQLEALDRQPARSSWSWSGPRVSGTAQTKSKQEEKEEQEAQSWACSGGG